MLHFFLACATAGEESAVIPILIFVYLDGFKSAVFFFLSVLYLLSVPSAVIFILDIMFSSLDFQFRSVLNLSCLYLTCSISIFLNIGNIMLITILIPLLFNFIIYVLSWSVSINWFFSPSLLVVIFLLLCKLGNFWWDTRHCEFEVLDILVFL